MSGRGFNTWRGLSRGVLSFGAVLAIAAPAFAADAPTGQVTFSKDVAPILQAKCQSCHQPNSIAPMSLITYQESRPWARSIKDRVASRQMPPWHIDPSVGVQHFKNDMSLTQDQIDTIVKWVDGGALQGDPKDMPAPKPLQTDNQWQGVRDGFGEPDLVVKSSEYTMPAKHQDVWYRPTSDIPLTEPRWVKMVEIRPSNLKARKIIHHSIAYIILNPDNVEAVNTGTATGGFGGPASVDDLVNRRPQLMEWAIGKGYDLYREGTGKLMMPGEKISWDQHIHAVGEEITGGSEIGIWFYPKGQEPKKRSYLIGFTGVDRSKGLDIAPNSISHTEGFTVLKENTLITNFQPHFHLRGKAMQVEAILPNGNREIISYVGNFNFNWMTNYIYTDDASPVFPKGTVIHVTAYYDNTKANKNNPDPDQWVGYGDRTVDEMAHAWMNVVYLNDDEYKTLVEERKAKAAKNTQDQQ
jgi:mono/diheme cytochrome c family protein